MVVVNPNVLLKRQQRNQKVVTKKKNKRTTQKGDTHLVETMNFAHSALDVEGLDVLPSLLQEGDEEVDCHLNVDGQFLWLQSDVTDGNTDAKNLLQLELDSALEIVDLLFDVFGVGEQDWELVCLVQMWSEQTWNLTNDGFGSQKAVVLVCELLDGLLLLVLLHVSELFEFVHVEEWDSELLCLITMLFVSENAELVLGLGDAWQLDGSRETLIFLWIVVLQSNLEFDGFNELALGGGCVLDDGVAGFQYLIALNFFLID